MTNSVTRTAGKRDRLVESATALFHEQGVQRTTLAEVAERAEVPLGNVYYYFKTKDELVGAVLAGYQEQAATLIDTFERGRRDARDLAVALFAGIQGAALLANTFRDPSLLTRQTRHLERWIDSLTA